MFVSKATLKRKTSDPKGSVEDDREPVIYPAWLNGYTAVDLGRDLLAVDSSRGEMLKQMLHRGRRLHGGKQIFMFVCTITSRTILLEPKGRSPF